MVGQQNETGETNNEILFGAGDSKSARIINFQDGASDNIGGLKFNVFSGATETNAITVLSGGNVGIGTIAPTGKLQVHNDGSGIKVLNEDVTGQLFEVYGDNGSLLTINDDLSDSLLRVNDAAGLPVFEVFANDTVIAGQYNQNDLVVTGNKVGISTAAPSGTLHVHGDMYLKDATTNASATEYLVLGASNIIEKRTGGTQGAQGFQGLQGVQGIIGPQGPQGIQGVIGPQGLQGLQGIQGAQGIQGTYGAQGPAGVQGSDGAQGFQGFQGLQGLQGIQGAQGIQGTYGAQGPAGVQGSDGAQGFQGFQGLQGLQGIQGAQGIQGTYGAQGPTGIQGADGAQGLQGLQGFQGVQGIIGPQGLQGVQGIIGPQGIQGTTGDSFWTQASGNIYPTTITDNVGIGTATPGARLEIETDSNVVKGLVVDANSSVYAETAVTIGSERTASNAYTLLDCVIDTDGTPISALKVQGDGNVGIGTDAPSFSAIAGNTVKGLEIANSGNDTQASLRLTGHNNTGTPGAATHTELKHAGANLRFDIDHNGTTVLTINSGSNVGIGTVSPTSKLHVYGNDTVSSLPNVAAQFSATGTGGLAIGDENGTDPYLGLLVATDNFHIKTGGNNTRFTILANGNVGIGTTGPSNLLHVYNNTAGTPSEIKIENATANYNAALQIKTTVSDWDVGSNIVAAAGSFEVYERTGGSTGGRFTILSGGNVGIGTVSPGYKLQVEGNGRFGWANTSTDLTAGFLSGIVGGGLKLFNVSAAVNQYSNIDFRAYDADARIAFKATASNKGDFHFITEDNSTASKVVIKSDGNVGIGTTAPLQKLTIAGRANSDQAADYYGAWFDGNSASGGYNFFAVGAWYNTSCYFQRKSGQNYTHLYEYNATHNIVLQAGSAANGEVAGAGNVGIGTVAPTGKLQVHKDGSGIKVLNEDVTGQLFEVYGDNGSLLTINDDLSDSLLRVNDAAGLPVFEVFANDTVIAGQYNQNDLVVTGNKVGISTAAPSGTLHVHGDMYLKDATTNASATEYLVLGASNIIEKRTGGTQGAQGFQGLQGVQGIIGPQGPQGIQGV